MVAGQRPVGLIVPWFNSVDLSKQKSNSSSMGKQMEEPSTKRSKPVSKVTSLANLLPPVKTAPLKRIGLTLQRSISFRNDSRTERATPLPSPHFSSSTSSATMKTRVISATVSNPSSSMTVPRVSTATSSVSKRRDSKLWSETFDVRLGATQSLSPKEINRQEAIFELVQGEQDLVEDLKLAKKAYHDPMLKLSIMTEEELNQIFGTLDSLIPLHEDLLSRLRDARKPDGSTEHVGHILTDWLPCLSSYTPYCSNQVKAKALLDQKKQDRRVQDFLQRCIQSPFSRKLDLWNFLDIPRSRLVKYPLLLREILKHTANDHQDRQHLDEAMLMVQSVVADINRRTGESECQYYKDRLLYAEDGQKDELIERSRTLSCHGELKNNRGLKLHVFLFQDVLVITRTLSLNDQPIRYQLCRQPIPIRQLDLEDLSDGEMRVGGSIRGAFGNNERTKNFFRVSLRGAAQMQSYYFQASDAFNKQQWINCIRQAREAAALTVPPVQSGPTTKTTLSSKDSSLTQSGKMVWKTVETGMDGVSGIDGEEEEEESEGNLEGEKNLEVGAGSGVDRETRPDVIEVKTGVQVEAALRGDGQEAATAEWKMDGNVGMCSGHGAPTSFPFVVKGVENERRAVEEEGEEEAMDTGDSLSHRC